MKIEIKEFPSGKGGTVKVTRGGIVHSGRWNNNEEVSSIKGDGNLLHAVMTAWNGQKGPFELSDQEVEESGGGHWSASPAKHDRSEDKRRLLQEFGTKESPDQCHKRIGKCSDSIGYKGALYRLANKKKMS